MNASIIPALVVLTLGWSAVVSSQTAELWFPTTSEEFVEPAEGAENVTPLLERAAYDRLVQRVLASDQAPHFIPLMQVPTTLSPQARFGINFSVFGQNRGFVVDVGTGGGYTLYADQNGNGVLTDDESVALVPRGDYYSTRLMIPGAELGGGPIAVWFIAGLDRTADGSTLVGAVHVRSGRRGVMRLNGQAVGFRLSGTGGVFDYPTNRLWVDLDTDGRESPAEMLQVRERRFRIGDSGYEFTVDRLGRGLAVRRFEGPVTERPTLAVENLAPNFTAIDIEGRRHQLSDYRGRVVLLDFWATWCVPCRIEAPFLKALHARYERDGLVILGITSDPSDLIRATAAEFGDVWPQISEPVDGPVATLFRVNGLPTHFVIARDGSIAFVQVGGLDEATFDGLIQRHLRIR